MNHILTTLTEEEMQHQLRDGEEAGFGSLQTRQGPLPLKAMDVRTWIDGLLSRTVLRQTFVNTLQEPLEATYIFPLPDRAAVTRFRMELAGRVVEGVLQERGQARRNYDNAIQEGRRAAITEEERPGVFSLRVGNLMPGEEAVIQLTLTGPLTYSDGEATYRFPLVVAPRYIPGTPLTGVSVGSGVEPDTDAVPDASRISPPVLLPGFPNPVRLSVSVELRSAGLTITDLRSSLHSVLEETREDCTVIRMQPGERLNRDFILRFRVGEKAVQSSLVLQPDEEGKEGTFLLTLLPPTQDSRTSKPRDVVFILDRSGSMGGWKMVAARRALARMVDTLTDSDCFTVHAFDDKIETFSLGDESMVTATDRHRYRAVEFLARIEARGGTEMAGPLDRAVTQLASTDSRRDRILVLVTDGQVGNEDQILHALGNRLQGIRIFTLGIDQAVNAGFLKRLACLGGGYSELVESEDRLDEVMDRVHRRIGTPVLTGLKLEPSGLEVDRSSLVPGRLPDLFTGTPLVLLGRYRGLPTGAITVQARDTAGRMWTQTLPAHSTNNPALTWTWARGRVRELEDRYASGLSDRGTLEKQIVETSLSFGVLCRFTAFVAVDVKEVVNPGGETRKITQPVEPAAGWAMLQTDSAPGASPARAAKKVMLARQVLQELNDDGSISKKTPPCAPPPCAKPVVSASAMFSKKRASAVVGATGIFSTLSDAVKSLLGGQRQENAAASIPETASTVASGINLSAYRQRARELLQRLQWVTPPDDRLTELGVLTVQLTALVEDLRSIGVAQAIVQPLVELLNELTGLMGKEQPREAEIGRLWSQSEQVLHAFSQDDSPAAKREGFWK